MGSKMHHPLDIGKNRFRKLVNNEVELRPRLPLVHSTDIYTFEDVLASGNLNPQKCEVFKGEWLTYLFSGRPSFRPNLNEQPTGLQHYLPVCIIFRSEWIIDIKRMFPFDSGGFLDGFYGAYLHSKMKLGDFGLEPDLSTPGKVISKFFGSIEAYLLAQPNQTLKSNPSDFEAMSYESMIHAKDKNAVDSRGSGIEVQCADSIDISKAVAAVIMPSTFADSATGTLLKTLGIDLLPYRALDRMRPNEYTSEVHNICLQYYVSIGILNADSL
jgi:hypothetical protein